MIEIFFLDQAKVEVCILDVITLDIIDVIIQIILLTTHLHVKLLRQLLMSYPILLLELLLLLILRPLLVSLIKKLFL